MTEEDVRGAIAGFAELSSDYGEERGGVFKVCLILEFEDGLVSRETRYYAESFEAPEARAQWRLR
jgi:hypothetical protein